MSWRLSLTIALVCGLMLSGTASIANGDALHVVATHGILADVTRAVAGDQAEVSSLIPIGADPHAFVPTPSDLTTLAQSDLVLINGAGYEEELLETIEGAGTGGNLVNASACIQIRPYLVGMSHGDEHGDDEHGDEHAHDDEHDDDHDDEHAHDDEHDDEHGDDDHDDEHAHDDDHDDEHAHDDDHDDEHAHDDDHDDEHAHDDEHGDEQGDDDHADEHAHDDDHADEHEMAGDLDCDGYDAEVAAIIGEEADGLVHFSTLGRGKDVDCLGAHDHGAGHEHEEGACDPHMWMDPDNVIYWALMIRDTLSAMDPDNAAEYAANATAYAQELVTLEADFILPTLAELPADKRVLITSHETLGYFATTFGFEIVSTVIPGSSTLVEPSARDMAMVVDRVRAESVPAIFSDMHLSDALVQTIAAEAGLEVFGLYSDALSDADGPAATYLDYMHYNVSTIVEALKGDAS